MTSDTQLVPFNLLEEFWFRCEDPGEPANMGGEIRVPGRLDADRLRPALAAAVALHPMTRAQRVVASRLKYPTKWRIVPACDLDFSDTLHVASCESQAEYAALRAAFLSRHLDTRRAPAVRLLLVHRPGGDSLLLCINHMICDGLGGLRFLHSIARAYTGAPEPPAAVDPIQARDLRATVRASSRAASPPPRRPATIGATTIVPQPDTLETPPYSYLNIDLGEVDRLSLDPHRLVPNANLNDLLLAALMRAIYTWNAEHGSKRGNFVVHAPINLRPRAWRYDVVASLAVSGNVGASDAELRDDTATLATVAKQTRWLLRGGATEFLLAPPWKHQVALRAMPLIARFTRPTTVLSNLGKLEHLPDFGEAGAATEFWGSLGLGMPTGLLVSSTISAGHLRLTLTFRRALFSDAAGREFAGELLSTLFRMGRGLELGRTEAGALASFS